jgi:hypothetical protein
MLPLLSQKTAAELFPNGYRLDATQDADDPEEFEEDLDEDEDDLEDEDDFDDDDSDLEDDDDFDDEEDEELDEVDGGE